MHPEGLEVELGILLLSLLLPGGLSVGLLYGLEQLSHLGLLANTVLLGSVAADGKAEGTCCLGTDAISPLVGHRCS
ncbi:hypothetical protein CRUP_032557 [Coryphaenoides rupestris]|nr:hypothetical protein CRUP_032557 [Coryphaenoides rupestris]